ncbi:MAG TPA: hypothetical protein VIM16_23905 [Mucilaginibacter sp.]|jgi:hypothetical protein
MKKSSILIAALFTAASLFIASNVKAQTKTVAPNPWRLGIGLEAGLPTGNANNISNFELGGTLRLQYDASSHFAWTLTSGYYNMFGKEIPGTTVKYSNLGIVPVKLGIKAFFAPTWYFGAEAGAGFETNSGGQTKLILSPALGYANKTWDVGVRYENFSGQDNSYGLAGLRIAYAFGL